MCIFNAEAMDCKTKWRYRTLKLTTLPIYNVDLQLQPKHSHAAHVPADVPVQLLRYWPTAQLEVQTAS